MSQWVRLWEDMPNDPKWRVIARRAGRPVSEVLAVFVHMLTNAGAAASRGNLQSWSDEDVAIAIDADPDHIAAIRQAMQGKTLDGEKLSGWDKRQPKREDGAAERSKEWRERKKSEEAHAERNRTQPNATEHLSGDANASEPPEEKREDTDIEKKDSCPKRVRAKVGYSEDFERFWSGYPTDPNMPKKKAWEVWQKLPPEDREKAIKSLPGFRAHCQKNPDYRPVYAERYLSQARYNGYIEASQKLAVSASSKTFFVKEDTPQWRAWQSYLRAATGRVPNAINGGWYFATEWPPNSTPPPAARVEASNLTTA